MKWKTNGCEAFPTPYLAMNLLEGIIWFHGMCVVERPNVEEGFMQFKFIIADVTNYMFDLIDYMFSIFVNLFSWPGMQREKPGLSVRIERVLMKPKVTAFFLVLNSIEREEIQDVLTLQRFLSTITSRFGFFIVDIGNIVFRVSCMEREMSDMTYKAFSTQRFEVNMSLREQSVPLKAEKANLTILCSDCKSSEVFMNLDTIIGSQIILEFTIDGISYEVVTVQNIEGAARIVSFFDATVFIRRSRVRRKVSDFINFLIIRFSSKSNFTLSSTPQLTAWT